NAGAALGHGLAEDAAAATDVQYALAGQADALVDPVDPQRIDVVQRFELAFAIPPAVCQGLEFGDFGAVDVAHKHLFQSWKAYCRYVASLGTGMGRRGFVQCMSVCRSAADYFLAIFSPQARALAISSSSSMRVRRPSSSNCLPPTHRCFTQSRPLA